MKGFTVFLLFFASAFAQQNYATCGAEYLFERAAKLYLRQSEIFEAHITLYGDEGCNVELDSFSGDFNQLGAPFNLMVHAACSDYADEKQRAFITFVPGATSSDVFTPNNPAIVRSGFYLDNQSPVEDNDRLGDCANVPNFGIYARVTCEPRAEPGCIRTCCCQVSPDMPCLEGVSRTRCNENAQRYCVDECWPESFIDETSAPTAAPTADTDGVARCCCQWNENRPCLPGFPTETCTANPRFSCQDQA